MKSAKVHPVRLEAFEGIHAALLHDLNPAIPAERWRRIFAWGWENPEDHVGHALVTADGDYVGYAGTLYSDLEVDGRTERICNLTSWIVKEGYGAQALALVMPVIRRPDLTVTNLTSLETVNEMFRKLGFRTLDTHTCVFPPWARGAGGEGIFAPVRIHEAVVPTGLPLDIPPAIAQAITDLAEPCHHWLFESGDRWCHLAFTVGRRRRMRSLRLHHLSDPALFVSALPQLSRRFLLRHRAPLSECDERLLGGQAVEGVWRVRMPVSRLYRSSTLVPAQISNLRTELALLNL